jgi:6-phospho-3-hexuloisomerase
MATAAPLTDSRAQILHELQRTLTAVSQVETDAAGQAMLAARRIFTTGAGRSGLALKMAAMRLMHLGLTVHVAGEVTTPAVAVGDLLIVASGSGTTAGAVQAAQTAKKAGATLLLLTTAPQSPLGQLADLLITIPAATKQDHGGTQSQQYAGALFEQSVLLLTDAIFQQLWQQRGESAEELWTRHANLE